MSVEFDTDEPHKSLLYAKILQPANEPPGLISWLKKTGLAKSDAGANKILICVMVFSLVLTVWTVYKSSGASRQVRATPEESAVLVERLNIQRR